MKLTKSTVSACFAVIWCCSASAREGQILDFAGSPVSNGVGTDTGLQASFRVEGVKMEMRSHFETNGLVHRSEGVKQSGNPLDDLRARNLSILQWMDGRSIDSPTFSSTLTSVNLPQYFEKCDGTRYVPTWWLSLDAEYRRAFYSERVAEIACEFGLPTSLLDAVIAQESGYKSWAVSSAGAIGIMQIMPGTARLLGLTTPFDPIANMRAGARYLRQQMDRFGRVDLALAAYNAGPERRSLQAGYVPAIPETLNYVRTITTNWGRLAQISGPGTTTGGREKAALEAVQASCYRSVQIVRYDGLNSDNPM